EVFDPTAFRNADLSVVEELDVCSRVNLNRGNQYIIDIFRLDSQTCECIEWSLIFRPDKFAALTKTATPTLVQGRKIFGRSSVDDGCLAITADHNHPKIELDPIGPVAHPVHLRTHHVAMAHFEELDLVFRRGVKKFAQVIFHISFDHFQFSFGSTWVVTQSIETRLKI